MPSQGYEEVDHTADIALRIWGENFQVLLRQAAAGLYDLMGIAIEPGSHLEARFDLSYETNETLLVDFLSELLYLSEEKGQAFDNFAFVETDDILTVLAIGSKVVSQVRHIKAVTFHDLNVEKTDSGLEATITYDV